MLERCETVLSRVNRALILPGVVLASLFVVQGAAGRDLLDPTGLMASDRQVSIYAESVSRDVGRDLLVAEGAVDIRSGELRLRADRVELDRTTMVALASGNVFLEAGGAWLQGEYLELDLRNETGHIVDGQGYAEQYYFKGARIDKLPDDQYHITDGSFTACEGVLPDWSFHSPDTLIHIEHYIYTWHPSLWIKRIPAFYLPYAVVPIKRDRATGLLVPRIRYHKTDGIILENKLFWAPVDNADATLAVDYYSRRGLLLGLEGNYVFSGDTAGTVTGSWIRDRIDGRERWRVAMEHRNSLPLGATAQVMIDYLSDSAYNRDYGADLATESQEATTSFAAITKAWDKTTLVVSARRDETLGTGQTSVSMRLPEVTLNRVETSLDPWEVFHWSLRASATGLRQEALGEKTSTNRYNITPQLSLPVKIQSWAAIKPSVEVDVTYYTRDTEGQATHRVVPDAKMELTGPRVYRIYGDPEEAKRFKHLVVPKFTYRYVPEVDQETVPLFDNLDRLRSENSGTVLLTNQVLGKFARKEGEGADIREMLKLDVWQKYRFDATVDAEGVKRTLGTLNADLSLTPIQSFILDAQAEYDWYDDRFANAAYGFSWAPPGVGSVGFKHRRNQASGVDYLEGALTVTPGPWSLGYEGRYDLAEDLFVEQTAKVMYTAKCWDVVVSYQRDQDSFQYMFELNFKEIGTILKIR